MKKAKVIIPALAALTFSVIASVTGTVAWFTSQSSIAVNTSEFTVTGLEGSLNVNPTAGMGTRVDGANETTVIAAKTGTNLTHGSFDIKSKKVFSTDLVGAYTNKPYAYLNSGTTEAHENDWMENITKGVYNAYSWSLTFKYGSGDTFTLDKQLNVYFDVASSSATASAVPADETTPAAMRAFRLAMICGDKAVVWSPHQGLEMLPKAGATGKASCHVGVNSSDSSFEEQQYDGTLTGDLIYKQDSTVSYISEGEGIENRKDCIAKFVPGESSSVTVDFVAWYEGCDDTNIQTGTTLKGYVKSNLAFYVRQNKIVSE